ncbi:DrmB family protein [Winogradskyella poriferorum]|uniref:DrmB family protein n=1 Tax=Winogradskyella poriferorum TaxID=307627 RepID=UPI003D65996A
MNILQAHQYNQGIGKYKLLSSTAGVGSIITTKFGTYILISDINKWQFVNIFNNRIKILLQSPPKDIYDGIKREAKNLGLTLVDDKRFVKFIQHEKELNNLECLVAIPQMALNEMFNSVNWTKKVHGRTEPAHPIAMKLNEINGNSGKAEDYQIQGTHFPKWFLGAKKVNGKQDLKQIDEWKAEWIKKGNAKSTFSPPRDANAPIKDADGNQIRTKSYTDSNNEQRGNIPLFKELSQTNLILICPNGHLSDISWSKYLNWKTQKETFQLPREDSGENLFTLESCCSNPNIKWSESTTKSEGYGSVYIECSSCGLGSGSSDKPKITLEGINSLKPKCPGHKPWEIDPKNPEYLPFEKCHKNGDKENNEREEMSVALVTANNTYYANGFSSLFIPMHLAENMSQALKKVMDAIDINLSKTTKTKEKYWEKNIEDDFEDFLRENDVYDESLTIEILREAYFKVENKNDNQDFHENYRFQEYKCFSQNTYFEGTEGNKGLSFKDIDLNESLSEYFVKIQQVDELKVTNIQFDFTRVRPKERIVKVSENGDRDIQESSAGQNIFSISNSKEDLHVMPANETLGEGLFFQFDDQKIENWLKDNPTLHTRFNHYLDREVNSSQQGASFMQKIKNNGIKHFLIHSFSHMMMRELEFSCGYPTASLKERLYISSNPEKLMSGVLIYTAEGSEGSMGGLVSQGEPEKILEIIKKGLDRSVNCSSDPLCWESDGQGIYDLNLSACFSCSLVAETACEEMNLGLDRRVLVDEIFGFFKN